MPIHWLHRFQNSKVADDYADFYDGTWDSGGAKSEEPFTAIGPANTPVWNGSNANGTKHTTRYAGASVVATGAADSTSPLGSTDNRPKTQNHRYYALSPVITVE